MPILTRLLRLRMQALTTYPPSELALVREIARVSTNVYHQSGEQYRDILKRKAAASSDGLVQGLLSRLPTRLEDRKKAAEISTLSEKSPADGLSAHFQHRRAIMQHPENQPRVALEGHYRGEETHWDTQLAQEGALLEKCIQEQLPPLPLLTFVDFIFSGRYHVCLPAVDVHTRNMECEFQIPKPGQDGTINISYIVTTEPPILRLPGLRNLYDTEWAKEVIRAPFEEE